MPYLQQNIHAIKKNEKWKVLEQILIHKKAASVIR